MPNGMTAAAQRHMSGRRTTDEMWTRVDFEDAWAIVFKEETFIGTEFGSARGMRDETSDTSIFYTMNGPNLL